MNPILVAAAAAGIAGFGAAWKVQDWRHDAAVLAASDAVAAIARDNVKQRDRAAEAYQDGQEAARRNAVKQDPKVIYVASKPEYRADCLDDDGLRLVADEVRAANARRRIAPPVPGASGAGGQVEAGDAAVERGDDPAVR